jgi:hypothetical protein
MPVKAGRYEGRSKKVKARVLAGDGRLSRDRPKLTLMQMRVRVHVFLS